MKRLGLLVVLLAFAACEDGSIKGPPGQPPPVGQGGGAGGGSAQTPCDGLTAIDPGESLTRRLSQDEYAHAVSDLFGTPAITTLALTHAATFSPDPTSLGFRNNARFLSVKNVLLQQYMDAADAISIEAVKQLATFAPCAAGADQTVCATDFIARFGRKAYRRALTPEEVAAYGAIYTAARTRGDDYGTGIEWVTHAFLLSPDFLYRFELDAPGAAGMRPLTSLELASRLSFLIWRTAPDEALLQVAEAGQLATADDVAREAVRLLADPKAERGFSFYDEWLDLDELSTMARDATVFPNLDPALPALLRGEAEAFVKAVVFQGDGKLSTLLGAPYTYVNGPLARHYGLPNITGNAWQRVDYTGERAGILMQGGVLTVHDRQTRTSIVTRGLRVRTQVLCQVVPAPPDDVPTLLPISAGLSQADRLAQHRENLACAGCHNLMDPIGQTFEDIDAVGRSRTVDEGGRPITTAGEIANSRETDGVVASGKALVTKLSTSPEVNDCFVTQYYRYAMGRADSEADACTTHRLNERFRASGGDIRDLVVALTQSDAFLSKRVAVP